MEFVIQVNINPSHEYACIHEVTSCPFVVNERKPPMERKSSDIEHIPYYETPNTEWYGPFSTYERALSRVKEFHWLSGGVRDCSFCKPMKNTKEVE